MVQSWHLIADTFCHLEWVGVNISLSDSNTFVDISLDTYIPIFKFLAQTNSSIKQTN